jgi:hypothetical protein
MFVVELGFTDHPNRLRARPAHRERLAELHARRELVAAGPWSDDTGALLLFDVDEEQLDQILDQDPYYRTPGVNVLTVRAWTPIVGPGGA